MDFEKTEGMIFIILGLIFILFPMFSAELVSILIGLSLVFFGISAAILGYKMEPRMHYFKITSIIIGIISILLGLLFIFYINAISFIVAYVFYIVGFIMIVFGITGLMAKVDKVSKFTSILVLLMGILTIAIGVFAGNNPMYLTIIIGIVLLLEGVAYLLED